MIYETVLLANEKPVGIGWFPVILSNGIFKSSWFTNGVNSHEGGKPVWWLKEVEDTRPNLVAFKKSIIEIASNNDGQAMPTRLQRIINVIQKELTR